MNKQMERDLKRRKTEEKREQRRREYYAKMPEYKGIKPRARIFYPIVVVDVEVKNFINKLFYWSEERGEKFLSRYWMRAAHWDEDEKVYYVYIRVFYLDNWYWSAIVKNPILKKWARKNKFKINKLFLSSNWTPSGFEKRVILEEDEEWYTIEFRPIQED